MRRAALSLLLATALLLPAPPVHAADPPVQLLLDGRPVPADVPPQIIAGRTLVPVRAIVEALGAQVAWDPDARTVQVSGSHSIRLTIDSQDALVDGAPVTLDVPAQVLGGRTLVPVRFLAQSLGFVVSWDDTARAVRLFHPWAGLDPERQGDLVAYIVQRPRAAAHSEAFQLPPAGEPDTFAAVVAQLSNGQPEAAAAAARPLGYHVLPWLDAGSGRRFWVLTEGDSARRYYGTYVFAQTWQRNLVLEVPHPVFDRYTPDEGALLLLQTGARALFVSDTHRCASSTLSGCSGTSPCGEQVISDQGHSCQTYFQAAHRAMDPTGALAISLHGFDGGAIVAYLAVVSDGTVRSAATDWVSNRVASSLNRALAGSGADRGAVSCNGDGWRQLCGSTNVQGRFSNGSPDPCTVSAERASGRFVHLEQAIDLRNPNAVPGPAAVAAALIQAISAVPPG